MADRALLLDRGPCGVRRAGLAHGLRRLQRGGPGRTLEPADLESWGRAGYMRGDDDAYVSALERAYALHQGA